MATNEAALTLSRMEMSLASFQKDWPAFAEAAGRAGHALNRIDKNVKDAKDDLNDDDTAESDPFTDMFLNNFAVGMTAADRRKAVRDRRDRRGGA
jgi:hypothetical protein